VAQKIPVFYKKTAKAIAYYEGKSSPNLVTLVVRHL
jgi:hypothetical protein